MSDPIEKFIESLMRGFQREATQDDYALAGPAKEGK